MFDLNKEVPNVELCKKLKELGFPQAQPGYYWVRRKTKDGVVVSPPEYEIAFKGIREMCELNKSNYLVAGAHYTTWWPVDEIIKAPTCRELGEWLPDHLIIDKSRPCAALVIRKFWYKESPENPERRLVWCVGYDFKIEFRAIANAEPDARAKMLIWLVENGYITFNRRQND
ncbi:hypothetical protein DRN32_06405 [Thermococci archaeon]|nr:MAG: hypothetical protein DRN32_06405 [Thermococci archaeon]